MTIAVNASENSSVPHSVAATIKWVEGGCLGKKGYQSFPEGMACEMTGKVFDEAQLAEGFKKVFRQLTQLKVGVWVTEQQARKHAAQTQR